jgi:hypothetical protein
MMTPKPVLDCRQEKGKAVNGQRWFLQHSEGENDGMKWKAVSGNCRLLVLEYWFQFSSSLQR